VVPGQADRAHCPQKKQRADPTPSKVEKCAASRFYQLTTEKALIVPYLIEIGNWDSDHCWHCGVPTDE